MKHISFLTLFFSLFLFIQCSSDSNTVENLDNNRVIKEDIIELEDNTIKTGNYGNLMLAFDGNRVTGYYNLITGGGQYGCTFYFYGKSKGNPGKVPIWWYFPGDADYKKGTLIIKKSGEIHLKVDGNPGGQCMPELIGDGEIIQISNENNWKSIRVIKTQKSPIFEEADEAMETGMHFEKGEIICVLEEKKNWMRVEHAGGEKVGWIKSDNLEILK